MFTDIIFQNQAAVVPDISIEVLRHVDLGDRVICAYCTVNGLTAKRLTQDIYGQQVNAVPVWNLDGRIVADWFASIIESKYKAAIDGETIVIHPDFV